MALRVLVVDDTVLFRRVISEAAAAVPNVEVVGTAATGRSALARMAELDPDLVTLDVEMPDMNGLDVLAEMKKNKVRAGVIMVSSLTTKGSDLTIKALELGAFDFVTKPNDDNAQTNQQVLREKLSPMLRAYTRKHEIKSILQGKPIPPAATATTPSAPPARPSLSNIGKPEMVLIGVSTGGPVALTEVIPKFPADFPLPILVVQHMPPMFTKSLATSLHTKSQVKVQEAEENQEIAPGNVYIAPGGHHMKLIPGLGTSKMIRITDDPQENGCRPAVDYLFRSVATSFPGKSIAVIMTGMGSDGSIGLKLLKRSPCLAIVQDEASSVVFGMPGEAIKTGLVDIVVPVDQITREIIKAVGRS